MDLLSLHNPNNFQELFDRVKKEGFKAKWSVGQGKCGACLLALEQALLQREQVPVALRQLLAQPVARGSQLVIHLQQARPTSVFLQGTPRPHTRALLEVHWRFHYTLYWHR